MKKIMNFLDEHCSKPDGFVAYLKLLEEEKRSNPNFLDEWDPWCYLVYFANHPDITLVDPQFLCHLSELISANVRLSTIKEREIAGTKYQLNFERFYQQVGVLIQRNPLSAPSIALGLFLVRCVGAKTEDSRNFVNHLKLQLLGAIEKIAEISPLLLSTACETILVASRFLDEPLYRFEKELPLLISKEKPGEALNFFIQFALNGENPNLEERAQQLIKNKHTRALYIIGRHFSKIDENKGDLEKLRKGADWLLQAAELGDGMAQYLISLCYLRGQGVPKDLPLSGIWLKRSAMQGVLAAQFDMGEIRFAQKQYFEAAQWYAKDSQGKILKTNSRLDECYQAQLNATTNNEEKKELLITYAQFGSPQAMYQYSEWCEMVGVTAQINFIRYQEAARRGSRDAKRKLAVCYEVGRYVTRDSKKAYEHYLEAAKAGCTISMIKVGFCLELGVGVDKDEQKAFSFYLEAADAGNADGHYNVGLYYLYNNNGGNYADKIFSSFSIASEKDHLFAKYYLGMCYYLGIGVAANIKKGKEILEELAARNFVLAKDQLQVLTSGKPPTDRRTARAVPSKPPVEGENTTQSPLQASPVKRPKLAPGRTLAAVNGPTQPAIPLSLFGPRAEEPTFPKRKKPEKQAATATGELFGLASLSAACATAKKIREEKQVRWQMK